MVECELSSLPFDSEKFDAVACVHAISHLLKKERSRVARELARVLKPQGHLLVEGFGRDDLRYGEGSELESGTYLRGNGIITHYFEEREIAHIFKDLELISETPTTTRVSFGAVSGRREIIRAVMRKR